MLLISQTMATYDEMPLRAICQQTLGMKEGRVAAESVVLGKRLEKKEREVNVKEMTGIVYGQLENKRDNVCIKRGGLLHVFDYNNP